MKAENHTVEKREINGTQVTITTYCIGGHWHCTVANIDPGANIARGEGETRESAMAGALEKADKRLRPATTS